MTPRFEDQCAVVTGGASGIGLATVRRFLSEGANVVIADLNQQTGDATMAELARQGYGSRTHLAIADASNELAVAGFMASALDTFGRLDIAYLNAGVGGAFGSIGDLEQSHWDETFSLLVRSVFLGLKYASLHMKQNGGSIIATSSIAGISGGAGGHPYSASKAAVVNLVRSAAIELASHRIRVNSVAPGLISTPLVHRGDETNIPPTTDSQPWPELGQPEDIAGVVAFLASADASFITGETIVVDGGLMANGANLWGSNNLFTSGRSGMNRGSTGLKPTIND